MFNYCPDVLSFFSVRSEGENMAHCYVHRSQLCLGAHCSHLRFRSDCFFSAFPEMPFGLGNWTRLTRALTLLCSEESGVCGFSWSVGSLSFLKQIRQYRAGVSKEQPGTQFWPSEIWWHSWFFFSISVTGPDCGNGVFSEVKTLSPLKTICLIYALLLWLASFRFSLL